MIIAPKDESYSGVVDHESVRLTMVLAENNDLQVTAADTGNVYLHGTTREKVDIVSGKEFNEEYEGRAILIVKSLYGLTTDEL